MCSQCNEYKLALEKQKAVNESLQRIIDDKNGYPTSVYFCNLPLKEAVDLIYEHQMNGMNKIETARLT